MIVNGGTSLNNITYSDEKPPGTLVDSLNNNPAAVVS